MKRYCRGENNCKETGDVPKKAQQQQIACYTRVHAPAPKLLSGVGDFFFKGRRMSSTISSFHDGNSIFLRSVNEEI